MTSIERDMAQRLSRCSFLPGSNDKRFAAKMGAISVLNAKGQECDEAKRITKAQLLELRRLFYKYRRQIGYATVYRIQQKDERNGA